MFSAFLGMSLLLLSPWEERKLKKNETEKRANLRDTYTKLRTESSAGVARKYGGHFQNMRDEEN